MEKKISFYDSAHILRVQWIFIMFTLMCWDFNLHLLEFYCLKKKNHLIKSMQCREQCFKQCFKPFVLAVGSSNSRSWRVHVCCCYVLSLFLRHNEFVLQLQLLYLSCKIQTKRKKIYPLFSLFVLEIRCQTELIKELI